MSDDVINKQMHLGKFKNTEEYMMAYNALKKFQLSKWDREKRGFRTLFLTACEKYNSGEIEL